MPHKKEWKSLRITLLLYIVVGLIPIAFYLFHSAFKELEGDTRVIHKTAWMEGVLASSAFDPNPALVKEIDQSFQVIGGWVSRHQNSHFYLGGQTLQKDFEDAQICWDQHKEFIHDSTATGQVMERHTSRCHDSIEKLTLIIENMVYLKQKSMVNMFYWNLSLAMFFALLLIYFVRAYIHLQMKKHAIHDEETGLFNRKYFNAELHTLCARAVRHGYPLTLLVISLDGYHSKAYNKRTTKRLMREIGEVFSVTARESDVACRYSENKFAILMPFTTDENGHIFEARIHQALAGKKIDNVEPKISVHYRTTQYDGKESDQAFLKRALSKIEA